MADYIKFFVPLLIILSSACSVEHDVDDRECFFKAYLTKKTYSHESLDFSGRIGDEIAQKYFEGEIAYFPYASGVTFYFGGTCQQADYWKKKVQPILKVKDITKEIYEKEYEIHHRDNVLVPLEVEIPDE